MPKTETIKIRLSDRELSTWILAAEKERVSLSEWIRSCCSRPEGNDNGNETSQNVSRAPRDSSTRRRGTSAGRESKRTDRTFRAPQKNSESWGIDSSPASNGDSGAVETTSAVGIPESVPVQRVIHTATSNRLTCLCNTCTLYRKNNSLPIGGLPKKEKVQR